MEKHFYHIRSPPLNATFFITHMRNCIMGATPMAASHLIPHSFLEYFFTIIHYKCEESVKNKWNIKNDNFMNINIQSQINIIFYSSFANKISRLIYQQFIITCIVSLHSDLY